MFKLIILVVIAEIIVKVDKELGFSDKISEVIVDKISKIKNRGVSDDV